MIRALHLLAPLSILAAAGCATAPASPSSIPSDREVAAYVQTNWAIYEGQFAFVSERRDQSAVLVSVTNVDCAAVEGDARCTFDVQGRFADGTVLKRPLESRFRRQADGSIEMLIPVVRG
ncbi:hypothetical protein [Brevundimonas sp.]|uniref:hypothetical protein n=1 Tax=Brevundimonas sp. TaxID=1871086 RepID=UPI003F720065